MTESGLDPLDPDILDRVRGLVSKVLRIPVEQIDPETPLIAQLGAESIDLLELRFLLEKEFHVKITDQELRESARRFTADDVVNKFCAGMVAWDIQERLKRGEES